MNTKIFAYCERGTDPSFWAEPVNAITNAAFIIAALAGLWLWATRGRGRRHPAELLLCLLVAVIGVGSFLFHTYATRWSSLADTIPIGIFMVAYLGLALRRFLAWSWIATAAGLVVFCLALWQSGSVRCGGVPCLNGSVGYLPALAVMVLIGGWLMARRRPEGGYVATAGLVFAASLTFRSLDRVLCGQTLFPFGMTLGTHFLWHLLNAVVLYLLLRAAILHRAGATASAKVAHTVA